MRAGGDGRRPKPRCIARTQRRSVTPTTAAGTIAKRPRGRSGTLRCNLASARRWTRPGGGRGCRTRASVRAKVEHSFHVLKNLLRHRKVRNEGLAKNEPRLFALFGVANSVIAKRSLVKIEARCAS